MQFHLVLVCVEVINGAFHSVKHFDLPHSKFCRKREVQHLGCEQGFSLLYQGIHRDWSSALYRFLHVAELLLDVLKPLLPRLLPYFLLDGPIASVVPAMPFLIAILSGGGGGFVRIMLLSLASLSLSIFFSRRVEVLLFFLGDGVLACRASWGCCICLVSCSNSRNKCWLVRQSAFISSVLACRVSSVPPGGRLSMSPCWSGILGGLAWLLLVFRVDTISH